MVVQIVIYKKKYWGKKKQNSVEVTPGVAEDLSVLVCGGVHTVHNYNMSWWNILYIATLGFAQKAIFILNKSNKMTLIRHEQNSWVNPVSVRGTC